MQYWSKPATFGVKKLQRVITWLKAWLMLSSIFQVERLISFPLSPQEEKYVCVWCKLIVYVDGVNADKKLNTQPSW